MKSTRHKRHYCSCPALHKVPAPRQKNSMHRCHCQLMKKSQIIKTNSKSTSELPMDYDDWKRTSERNLRTLSAVLDTCLSPSHPRSVSHPVSPFTLVHLSICYMALPLLASGLPQFCELCCPCGLHCVISGLLAGGSPGFRAVLCWFPISQSSCMAASVIVAGFVLFGLTAIPILRMTPWMIQCYHLSSSYRRHELTS